MRHGKKNNKLGRDYQHRKALLKNLANSLFIHGYITTTLAKAKSLRAFAEKIITKAVRVHKAQSLSQRIAIARQIEKNVQQNSTYLKLINVWGVVCLHRPGGYLRIIKLGFRKGDNAELAYIGIVLNDDYITNNNLEGLGFKSLFSNLQNELIHDHLLNKSLIAQWQNFKFPPIHLESSVSRNRKSINFRISFSNVGELEEAFWPIFDGTYVNLPIILQFNAYSTNGNSIECIFERNSEIRFLSSYNDRNTFKVLIPPQETEQIIEGKIKIISKNSQHASITGLDFCHLRICGPVGDLFLFNFKKQASNG